MMNSQETLANSPVNPFPLNPLGKVPGIIGFCLLVLLITLVELFVCLNSADVSDGARGISLMVIISVSVLAWYAFAMCKCLFTFSEWLVKAAVLSLPIMLMVYVMSSIWFWFSVLTLVAAVVWTFRPYTDKPLWKQFLNVLFAIWSVVCVYVEVGSTPLLPYATPALGSSGFRTIVDVRLLLTIVVGLFFFIVATKRAFSTEPPRMAQILSNRPLPKHETRPQIAGQVQYMAKFVFVVMANISISIVDLLLRAVSVIFEYLRRIAECIVEQLLDVLKNRYVFRVLTRMLPTIILIVLVSVGLRQAIPVAVALLRNNDSFFTPSIWISTLWIALMFAATFIVILFVANLHDDDRSNDGESILSGWLTNPASQQGMVAAAVIVVGCWLAGNLMFVVGRFPSIDVFGVRTMKGFSAIIWLVIGLLIFVRAVRRMINKSSV